MFSEVFLISFNDFSLHSFSVSLMCKSLCCILLMAEIHVFLLMVITSAPSASLPCYRRLHIGVCPDNMTSLLLLITVWLKQTMVCYLYEYVKASVSTYTEWHCLHQWPHYSS